MTNLVASPSPISVRFWGVRGSVPSPITPAALEAKVLAALAAGQEHPLPPKGDPEALKAWARRHLPFEARSTFGGNTTCVEVRCGDELLILDMGTGIRELGLALMPQTLADRGIRGTILQSHVHWDHVQGYPFWPQLYMPRNVFDNRFSFFGGKEWDRSLEDALRGQMHAPMFPVDHRELERTALRMSFDTVWDGRVITLPSAGGDVRILCRKLNHPQETYGYRIEHRGAVVAFCTDHEPYAGIHRPLVELAEGADLFITDCQYTYHEYAGEGGKVQKLGWGHSYPEYVAQVAQLAKAKKVVTTHHDPSASDEHVASIAAAVASLSGVPTVPAHEGLTLAV